MDVSLITIGMNHCNYIRKLYESLFSRPVSGLEAEYIYVDNCSSDGSMDFLKQTYPQVRTLQNQQPLGFGANNNKGFTLATGRIIGIVNPDIIFMDNALRQIVNFIDQSEEQVIVAPELLNPDGSHQFSVRRFLTLKTLVRRLSSGMNDQSDNQEIRKYLCKDYDWDKIQPIDWSFGAALFMKKETYEKLGGFDERYFLYMEDEDLCLRAWKNGITVTYLPVAQLIHNHLRDSRHLGKKALCHIKSTYTFFKIHGLNVMREQFQPNEKKVS